MNTLHVRVKGASDKPALIFLHGFMGSGHDWDPITEAFAQHYHCVCIDLPGHGLSQGIKVSFESGFTQTHRLIEQTIATLHIDSYALVGYSLGGRIAMYHACQKPTGLKALVLESTNPGLNDNNAKSARRQHDSHWADRMRNEAFLQVLNDWYRQAVFASLSDNQRDELIKLKSLHEPQALAQMLQATSLGNQPDLTAKLASLPLPIALFCGERDTKFRDINQQLAQRLNPAIDCCFEQAGHNIHFEQPESYKEQLRNTLNQIYC